MALMPLAKWSSAVEQVIVDDFAQLGKAGLSHPMMADIENALGISRWLNRDDNTNAPGHRSITDAKTYTRPATVERRRYRAGHSARAT
jgi:hypothetical protein